MVGKKDGKRVRKMIGKMNDWKNDFLFSLFSSQSLNVRKQKKLESESTRSIQLIHTFVSFYEFWVFE